CAAVDDEGPLEPAVDGHGYPVHATVPHEWDLVARARGGREDDDERDGTEPGLRGPALQGVPLRRHVASPRMPRRRSLAIRGAAYGRLRNSRMPALVRALNGPLPGSAKTFVNA